MTDVLGRDQTAASGGEVLNRWPLIRRYLHVEAGRIDDDFLGWSWRVEEMLSPAERAVAYKEWADWFEWRLARRANELATDRIKRHLVEEWTDSMGYCCRRSAVWARGDDPGEWIPQARRRPDLHAQGQSIVADIIAELDGAGTPGVHLDAEPRHEGLTAGALKD